MKILLKSFDKDLSNLKVNKKKTFIFQQDNAEIHTSKLIMDLLNNQENIKIIQQSYKSPDLNLIENFCRYLIV